jgi:hypothetical protein
LEDVYPIRRLRRAPHISYEASGIFYHEFELDLETGVGLSIGRENSQIGVDPQVMLQWSDDGGHTFGNEHWVSAGRIGQFGRRAVWHRLGRSRDRVFQVVVTDPVKWCLIEAYLYSEPGRS